MKIEYKVIIASLGCGIMLWLVDTVVDTDFFNNTPYINSLIGNVPSFKMFIRCIYVLCFLIIGVIISSVLSRQKRIEEELKRSEKRYHSIFDSAAVSFWEYDYVDSVKLIKRMRDEGVTDYRRYFQDHPDIIKEVITSLKLSDINETTLILYGARSKEEILRGFGKYMTPEDYDAFREISIAFLEGKEFFEYETVNRTFNGKYINILAHVSFSGLFDGTDQPYKAMVSVFDITDRKKAEEMLRISEERYRNLVETSHDLIFRCDTAGRFTFLNRAWEQTLGYPIDEMLGKKYTDFVSDKTGEKDGHILNETLNGNAVHGYETTFLTKNSNTVFFRVNAVLLKDGKGRVIGAQGTAYDITRQKHLEEQLQIRQRMDSLGTLAGGIAHDFNNLLASIMGYIGMIEMDRNMLSANQQEYLKTAIQSCQRAASLIRKFQTLSKGSVLKKKTIDLFDVAEGVFQILKMTTDRLIEKRIEFGRGRFIVMADEDQLQQVFMNLGTNAVQALEERGVNPGDFISIEALEYRAGTDDEYKLREGSYIHVLFRDNGVGMTDEIKRRAFDPFFSTRGKGSKKGQGLGLAIVYNIVTQYHNGFIEIESAQGSGTVFHLFLPEAAQEVSQRIPGVVDIHEGRENILLIEDEKPVRRFMEEALSKMGYSVVTTINGKEGLEVFNRQRDEIDLVLLDLTMPELPGETVMNRMLETAPDTRIILISGQSREELLKHTRASGFLPKPFLLSDLARMVRSVLDT